MKKYTMAILFFLMFLSYTNGVLAGDADSPASPSGGSGMVTVNGLYNYLDSGEAPTESGSFQMPTTAPGSTMNSVQDIYTNTKAQFDQCNAEPDQVLSGVKYFSTDPAHWGPQTGTATVSSGSSCPYPAAVEKTGQTTSYGSGDDGGLGKGVDWPNPRFTDNGNGAVTDNLTGLVWLKNANCFGKKTLSEALSESNSLANGACGLSDGSSAADWRLPNIKELYSLIDLGFTNPALSNTAGTGKWTAGVPFTNVRSGIYWSSTTYVNPTPSAWFVSLNLGNVNYYDKSYPYYVWPVR